MSTSATLMTVQEFLKLPDPAPGYHLELHHGVPVTVPPPKYDHIRIQENLVDLLFPLTKGKGRRKDEFPFIPAPDQHKLDGHKCDNECEFFVADFGFVSEERFVQAEYFPGAPNFLIEVKSGRNTWDELHEKQRICLSNGCRLFWIIDSKHREIHATDADWITRRYIPGMQIPLTGILDESLSVDDIFAGLK